MTGRLAPCDDSAAACRYFLPSRPVTVPTGAGCTTWRYCAVTRCAYGLSLFIESATSASSR